MNVELTKEEADLLYTLLYEHVSVTGDGQKAVSVAHKLFNAGARLGLLEWHVNDLGHVEFDYFLIET